MEEFYPLNEPPEIPAINNIKWKKVKVMSDAKKLLKNITATEQ